MLIGEVSRRTGVSVRMLRHYEAVGLLTPRRRTSGGYREYGDEALRRILHIESLRSLDLSLEQVRSALEDPGFTPEDLMAELIARSTRRLRRERELLRRLRAVASSGAGDWEDVLQVVHLLRGLGSPDPLERQRAVLGTGGVNASPARALARSALREDDPNVAGALRWAVLRAGEEAVDAVAGALGSGDPAVRERAVRILGETEGPRHLPVLVGALDDADATVRGLAALALGQRGDPRAVPALLGMVLAGDRDVDAAEALGMITTRGPGAAAQVLRALREALVAGEGADSGQLRLAQALAEIPGGEAEELLRELADHAHRPVRLTATAILRRRGGYRT